MFWSKLLIILGYKYNENVIPKGEYCYEIDDERNKVKDSSILYIKPCPYYKSLGNNLNGCKFLGVITDDIIFGDQCKICDVNLDE